jgi:Secreted Novel AID/APOBEC-like Deaminase 4
MRVGSMKAPFVPVRFSGSLVSQCDGSIDKTQFLRHLQSTHGGKMDPNKNPEKLKRPEEIEIKDGKKQKTEGLAEKRQTGVWFINNDLKTCVEKNAPIVTYSGHTDYCFHPLSEGHSLNPFSLSMENEQTTVLLAKCNGFIFGRFINDCEPKDPAKGKESDELSDNCRKVMVPLFNKLKEQMKVYDHDCGESGSHAEDAFLSAWVAAEKAGVIEELCKPYDGKAFVTLKISRSPCKKCAPKLIKFVEGRKNVKLRIKVQTLYHGDGGPIINGQNVCLMISKGIAVREWNVPYYAAKRRQQKTTKLGQLHELHAWASDVDDDFHKLLSDYGKIKLESFYKYVGKAKDEEESRKKSAKLELFDHVTDKDSKARALETFAFLAKLDAEKKTDLFAKDYKSLSRSSVKKV